jgi:hypothetical protein
MATGAQIIVDGTIVGADISSNTINSNNISNGAVGTDEIADRSILSSKLEENITISGNLSVGGYITCVGDITGLTSDERLKTNVEVIENALDKLDEVSGVLYNWNELAEGKDQNIKECGVIAQEIQKVLPEAVQERSDGYLTVRYERIIPLLIQAIKELKEEIKNQI